MLQWRNKSYAAKAIPYFQTSITLDEASKAIEDEPKYIHQKKLYFLPEDLCSKTSDHDLVKSYLWQKQPDL